MDEDDEKKVEEEQIVFQKNSSLFLYDVAFKKELTWSSLCVEWLPGSLNLSEREGPDRREGYDRHNLVIGTHADTGENNKLLYVSVDLPQADREIDARDGQFGRDESEIAFELKHPGAEANKIRHLPQRPTILATMSANCQLNIYDLEKAVTENMENPLYTLDAHTQEGYGLNWHPQREGQLFSAAFDGCICAWDIGSLKSHQLWSIEKAHSGKSIGDLAFAPKRNNFFGTVGDDRQILLWDERILSSKKPCIQISSAHSDDINCIAFPPIDTKALDFLFTTGSADGTIKLWDCRFPKSELYHVQRPKDVVTLVWAPFETAVIAAAGADRRVAVYNFDSIHKPSSDQIPDQDLARFESEDSPTNADTPELLLEYAGHTDKLNDVSWNLSEEMLGASVATDNSLQIWWVSNEVYEDDFDDSYSFFASLLKDKANHDNTEAPQPKRPKLSTH